VNGWIDAAHDTVSTGADAHLSANHKRDPTEHLLFLNISAAESGTHTTYQSVIRGNLTLPL
jgi:hypothetical protein